MVGADEEAVPLEIWPPVSHSLNQTDQLVLVCLQLAVAGSEGSTEEGQGSRPLVQNGAKPDAGGVAVDHKLALKVGHLQDRRRRERPLEGSEGLVRLSCPDERLLP